METKLLSDDIIEMRRKEEEETIEELNSFENIRDMYTFIVLSFISCDADYIDNESELYDNLLDLFYEIEDLEIDYTPEEKPEINEKKLLIKKLINEAHKKGTLNYYYRPPKEDTEKED